MYSRDDRVRESWIFDDWGRMTGKTEGAKSATYYYCYGDKLLSSLSNFPGEHSWTVYEYDGLGRRRKQGLYQGGTTWFRWQGMEESGEYASAGNSGDMFPITPANLRTETGLRG